MPNISPRTLYLVGGVLQRPVRHGTELGHSGTPPPVAPHEHHLLTEQELERKTQNSQCMRLIGHIEWRTERGRGVFPASLLSLCLVLSVGLLGTPVLSISRLRVISRYMDVSIVFVASACGVSFDFCIFRFFQSRRSMSPMTGYSALLTTRNVDKNIRLRCAYRYECLKCISSFLFFFAFQTLDGWTYRPMSLP